MSQEIPPMSAEEFAERLFARVMVVAGGIFWMVAAFAGPFVFGEADLASSMRTAASPLLATVVTLFVARYSEEFAAVLLFAGSAAVAVWGVLYQWEFGVWMLMAAMLIAPMVTAAILFLLASRAGWSEPIDSADLGQGKQERRPFARARVDLDRGAVRFNDLFGDRQA